MGRWPTPSPITPGKAPLVCPFIEKRTYGGETFSVTEYTMSEILASVYQMMERTGLKEGFCSWTRSTASVRPLAPMMLQFLQCKTFGNQKLPEGWTIVAAGNPPESTNPSGTSTW